MKTTWAFVLGLIVPISLVARPNILICVADDWGWPHAGAYGDQVIQTPTFDRLAKEGVLFEHTYVSSPSCTPSRNALITGQQFYRLDEGANLWSTLRVGEPNFMQMLEDAGYDIGHWRKAWGPGFFKIGGYTRHPCGREIELNEFLEQLDPDKPFCFWFGSQDPHRPYDKGSGVAKGINADNIHVPGFYPDVPEIREDIADYYYEVERWDSEVGEALQLLARQGRLEDTIIIMTGDNGMPFPRCKANLYDWGTRMPMAMRWGDQFESDHPISQFISFTDIAPTILDAADIVVPPQMTGKSFLPLLTGEDTGQASADRDFVVMGRERHTPAQLKPSNWGYPSRAIRTQEWLLIMNLEPDRWPVGVPENATHQIGQFADCDASPTKDFIISGKDDPQLKRYYELCFERRGPIELYDCRKDPDQVNNLAEDPQYAEVVKRLHQQLVDYLESTGDPRFTEEVVMFDSYPYLRP